MNKEIKLAVMLILLITGKGLKSDKSHTKTATVGVIFFIDKYKMQEKCTKVYIRSFSMAC